MILYIFSGVPNPAWEVSFDLDPDLCSLIQQSPKEDEPPSVVGYAGFHLITWEEDIFFVGAESKPVQHALLESAPDDQVPLDLRQEVRQAIDAQ